VPTFRQTFSPSETANPSLVSQIEPAMLRLGEMIGRAAASPSQAKELERELSRLERVYHTLVVIAGVHITDWNERYQIACQVARFYHELGRFERTVETAARTSSRVESPIDSMESSHADRPI
jgi:hypothetical protein